MPGMPENESRDEIDMSPVMRWERVAFLALGLVSTIYLWSRLEERFLAMSDLLSYLVILVVTFHLTRDFDPLKRVSWVLMYSIGSMFLVRAGTIWLRGEATELTQELIRVAVRWGSLSFMCVWTALLSQARPPGQYVYNVVFVSPVALAMGQVLANLTLGQALFGGVFSSGLEGLTIGFAFSYVTVGRRDHPEEGKVDET